MNRHSYRAYYAYDGPTAAAPQREEKSAEEVSRMLQLLADQLSHVFGETAIVDVGPIVRDERGRLSRRFTIDTSMPASTCHDVVAPCLGALDLYGDRLSQ